MDDMSQINRISNLTAGPLLREGRAPGGSPAGPKWAYLGQTQTTITARSGNVPGSGTVDLWELDTSGPTLVDSLDSVDVYNLAPAAISASVWVMLLREPVSGEYFVVFEDCDA